MYESIEKRYHMRCDVLVPNDMKNMAKVLSDVMKLVAHEHVVCFALQFNLCCKDSDSNEKEE